MLPGVKLTEHSGSDKSVVFTCQDFSEEGAGKQEKFCIRFASVESECLPTRHGTRAGWPGLSG